jgi:hypothetical protein
VRPGLCPACGHAGAVLADLFAGPGGAGLGYQKAGWHVCGVDTRRQPTYPGCFILADALGFPLDGVTAAHASPPCQYRANVSRRASRAAHADLLIPTLAMLAGAPVPWIAENLPEACPPLRPDVVLCGCQFGLNVKRRRAFQLGGWSWFELIPPCTCLDNPALMTFGHKYERAFADAMGCGWLPKRAARQAIPPAYTEHLGRALLAELGGPSRAY